jgi:hypothetical protein
VFIRVRPWLISLAAFGVLTGCDSGPKTYHLTGAITFQGKPVPAGNILFEPDGSKGNEGQPGYAKIKDGKYDTRLEGQGVLGGPHQVRITGFDGVPRPELINGIPLFPDYTTTADLPKTNAVQDFEVRASANSGS